MRAYLQNIAPNPPTKRVPWHQYLAPNLVGLFLWFGFYESLSQGTIDRAPLGLLIFGLLVAGIVGFGLFYLVPARIGMQTGYPVGIIGSSTFGSQGGQVVPGLLIGAVQGAWLGVAAYLAARAALLGAGIEGGPASVPFLGVAAAWILVFTIIGTRGVKLASRLARFLALIPVVVLLYGLFAVKEGLPMHGLELPEPFAAFMLIIHLVIAFLAATAVAGPNLGRYAASHRDLQLGGLFGIILPVTLAGGIAIVTVAGARALNPDIEGFGYLQSIHVAGGFASGIAPLLLLVGAIPASAFLAWMAQDNLETMLPKIGRIPVAVLVVVIAALVVVSNIPANMQMFLTVVGALCAPICGIMVADYWQHDKRWPHTRPGINYAGYGAWLMGMVVGLVPLAPLPEHILAVAHPAAVYAAIVGFAAYIVLGNLGLKPYRKHRRRRVKTAAWDEKPREEIAAEHHHHSSSPARESRDTHKDAASSSEPPSETTRPEDEA